MTGSPADSADDAAAQRRYATIRHTIPERLDHAAQQLDDVLDLLARAGLGEALQPDAAPYPAVVAGLRAAANRIRTAAEQIPPPATWSAHPPRVVPVTVRARNRDASR